MSSPYEHCEKRHPERRNARCFMPKGHKDDHCAAIRSPDVQRARLGWMRTLKWSNDEQT